MAKYKKIVGVTKERIRTGGRNGGRPKLFDPLIIADEILEWSRSEDSINIAQFCADRGYIFAQIELMNKKCKEFADAYELTKMRLAERRERMLNNNTLNYGSFNRYQNSYDPFLLKHEDTQEDKAAARKRGIQEAEQMNLVKLARLAAKGAISQDD